VVSLRTRRTGEQSGKLNEALNRVAVSCRIAAKLLAPPNNGRFDLKQMRHCPIPVDADARNGAEERLPFQLLIDRRSISTFFEPVDGQRSICGVYQPDSGTPARS
jgi:hypothetical protein